MTYPMPAGEHYDHLQTFECTFAAEGVLNIAMNRPEKLNAQTQQMWSEVGEVFRLATRDPDVRCVILSGNGRAFTAGIDLGAGNPLGTETHKSTL